MNLCGLRMAAWVWLALSAALPTWAQGSQPGTPALPCTVVIEGQGRTLLLPVGYIADICPPAGRKIARAFTGAEPQDWRIEYFDQSRSRLFVAAGEHATTGNLIIFLDNGSRFELKLQVVQLGSPGAVQRSRTDI